MYEMKKGSRFVLLVFILQLLVTIHARRFHNLHHGPQIQSRKTEKDSPLKVEFYGGADTLQVAGSSLPDCTHGCGSCTPCRLVMVSFVCSTVEEAETCPMAYKCMCHNKSYPVP